MARFIRHTETETVSDIRLGDLLLVEGIEFGEGWHGARAERVTDIDEIYCYADGEAYPLSDAEFVIMAREFYS